MFRNYAACVSIDRSFVFDAYKIVQHNIVVGRFIELIPHPLLRKDLRHLYRHIENTEQFLYRGESIHIYIF